MAIDEDDAVAPIGAPPQFDQHAGERFIADGERAGKARMFAARRDSDARGYQNIVDQGAEMFGDDRVGGEWKVWPVLFTRAHGNEEKRLEDLTGGVFAERPWHHRLKATSDSTCAT